jgi:uncharacterized protein YbjT (DUF2867 family)
VILVVGASGYTGLAVIRALARRDAGARALIRDDAKAELALAAGAEEVAIADLRDVSAVERAAAGCSGIYFIGPRFMPEEAQVGKAIVDIAVRARALRFVYSGVYHPSISALLNHQAKLSVEDHLYKTDLEFTVLQPARFMHGPVLSSWSRIVSEGVFADAFNTDRPMAYVDYEDVAEVAAIALTEPTLVRGTFELSAAGEYTGHDVARHLGAAVGRSVRAEQASLDDYQPAQGPAMVNPYGREGFLRLRRYYDEYGFRGGNSLVLAAILGHEPADFPAFLAKLEPDPRD